MRVARVFKNTDGYTETVFHSSSHEELVFLMQLEKDSRERVKYTKTQSAEEQELYNAILSACVADNLGMAKQLFADLLEKFPLTPPVPSATVQEP